MISSLGTRSVILVLFLMVGSISGTPVTDEALGAPHVEASLLSAALCETESRDGKIIIAGVTAEKLISKRGAVGYCQVVHFTAIHYNCMNGDPTPLLSEWTNRRIAMCVVKGKIATVRRILGKKGIYLQGSALVLSVAHLYRTGYVRAYPTMNDYYREVVMRWKARTVRAWKVVNSMQP